MKLKNKNSDDTSKRVLTEFIDENEDSGIWYVVYEIVFSEEFYLEFRFSCN